MARAMRLRQHQTKRRFVRLHPAILLCLLGCTLLSCQPPCKKLGQTLCETLKEQKVLCQVAVQETAQKEVSFRRCQALLETWPTSGKKPMKAFVKRYKRYQNWVSHTQKMKRGIHLLALEKKAFRRYIRRLLGQSTPKTLTKSRPNKR